MAFLMACPLSPSVSPLGDRRYRDLLLECGGIAERIYLASEALGLATCNLAAFLDDDLNDLVGLDGIRRAVLHVTVIGHRI